MGPLGEPSGRYGYFVYYSPPRWTEIPGPTIPTGWDDQQDEPEPPPPPPAIPVDRCCRKPLQHTARAEEEPRLTRRQKRQEPTEPSHHSMVHSTASSSGEIDSQVHQGPYPMRTIVAGIRARIAQLHNQIMTLIHNRQPFAALEREIVSLKAQLRGLEHLEQQKPCATWEEPTPTTFPSPAAAEPLAPPAPSNEEPQAQAHWQTAQDTMCQKRSRANPSPEQEEATKGLPQKQPLRDSIRNTVMTPIILDMTDSDQEDSSDSEDSTEEPTHREDQLDPLDPIRASNTEKIKSALDSQQDQLSTVLPLPGSHQAEKPKDPTPEQALTAHLKEQIPRHHIPKPRTRNQQPNEHPDLTLMPVREKIQKAAEPLSSSASKQTMVNRRPDSTVQKQEQQPQGKKCRPEKEKPTITDNNGTIVPDLPRQQDNQQKRCSSQAEKDQQVLGYTSSPTCPVAMSQAAKSVLMVKVSSDLQIAPPNPRQHTPERGHTPQNPPCQQKARTDPNEQHNEPVKPYQVEHPECTTGITYHSLDVTPITLDKTNSEDEPTQENIKPKLPPIQEMETTGPGPIRTGSQTISLAEERRTTTKELKPKLDTDPDKVQQDPQYQGQAPSSPQSSAYQQNFRMDFSPLESRKPSQDSNMVQPPESTEDGSVHLEVQQSHPSIHTTQVTFSDQELMVSNLDPDPDPIEPDSPHKGQQRQAEQAPTGLPITNQYRPNTGSLPTKLSPVTEAYSTGQGPKAKTKPGKYPPEPQGPEPSSAQPEYLEVLAQVHTVEKTHKVPQVWDPRVADPGPLPQRETKQALLQAPATSSLALQKLKAPNATALQNLPMESLLSQTARPEGGKSFQ